MVTFAMNAKGPFPPSGIFDTVGCILGYVDQLDGSIAREAVPLQCALGQNLQPLQQLLVRQLLAACH
jgi:hypothetical protein